MKQVCFVDADKYVLAENYYDIADFAPENDIHCSYGSFLETGEYLIKEGFLFSANSPAINTFNTRRAACVHDFMFSLMKDGHLDRRHFDAVNYLFYDQLREDGMMAHRAWYWYRAVQTFGLKVLDTPRPPKQYSPKKPEYAKQEKFGMA